eukprot:15217890-Alexandrium_andersonii.AAC.1
MSRRWGVQRPHAEHGSVSSTPPQAGPIARSDLLGRAEQQEILEAPGAHVKEAARELPHDASARTVLDG